MDIQKLIRKPAAFAGLKLAGIEITNTLAGTAGTDFQAVTFKDTKTGTLITVSRGQYSDLNVHATFPQKMEKRFIVVSVEPTGEFRSKPLKADEVEAVKEAHPGSTVDEVDVPVEDET